MIFLTHHKCVSTFLGHYLADLTQANGLSLFGSHRGDALPAAESDVSYLTNANYDVVRGHLTQRCVHVIRNPLNIVQSAYYSHLSTHSTEGWPELVLQREILNSVCREDGMLLTIAFCERQDFYQATQGPLAALRRWDFDDPRVVTVRGEDLVADPSTVISSAFGGAGTAELTWPASNGFSFARFSGGRAPGTVDNSSHYRSGDPDAWRRELSPAAIIYIQEQFRALLERYYPEALS